MNKEILGDSYEENNRYIDRLFEMFEINPDELEKYIISYGLNPFIAKYDKGIGYSFITKNPKTVKVVEALVVLKAGLNESLSEEIESKTQMKLVNKKDN